MHLLKSVYWALHSLDYTELLPLNFHLVTACATRLERSAVAAQQDGYILRIDGSASKNYQPVSQVRKVIYQDPIPESPSRLELIVTKEDHRQIVEQSKVELDKDEDIRRISLPENLRIKDSYSPYPEGLSFSPVLPCGLIWWQS